MTKIISKRTRKIAIKCVILGAIFGFIISVGLISISIENPSIGIVIPTVIYFVIIGAVFGGSIPICISIGDTLSKKYNKLIRGTTIILALFLAIGFTCFIAYVWGIIEHWIRSLTHFG